MRWSDAVREAGFEPQRFQQALEEKELLEKFISLVRELEHWPVVAELRMKAHNHKGFPSQKTFARLGSKQQLAQKLLSYCEANAGHEDIAAFCLPIAKRFVSSGEDVPSSAETDIGFVYLMKSGRFYKIGHSNSAGRREYELSIQMPEKLTTVHAIRTDDPVEIETYWHQRFGAKRKNGEWFDLSSDEVRAFKRRKFM